MDARSRTPLSPRLLTLAGLALLVTLGAWLRWQYLTTISPYIDEFTTLWAAKQIVAQGVPIMPSGVLYTRGLLDSYLTALFMAVGGNSFVVGRLPSLLFGLATIPLVWTIGKKEWGAPVGWLAAIGLTLLPEAIVWSSRARFYAPLQTFALLTVWTGYRSARENMATWRTQLTFALMFALALFMQEETLLLYPACLLGLLLWRGRGALREPPVIGAQLLCLLAMGARYLIEIYGQPGYFETIQAERPYVGLFGDIAGTWRVYAPLFLNPERLLFTLGALAAVVGALGRGRGGSARGATLYFALALGSVLAIILLFVGETWRDTRYLYFVQPLWLLLGAAGIREIGRRLSPRPALALYAASAATAALLLLPPAQATLQQQQEGYDLALGYLAGQRGAGDVVLTPQPPACALMLGAPCDYYTLQRGYEEYVIGREGVFVDRWTGIPLLTETAQLEQVIRSAPRTWMAIDGLRLATRYHADFLATLITHFEVAHDTRGVAVLRADGWRDVPTPVAQGLFVEPPMFDGLRLDGWQHSAAIPGETLELTMTWHGEGRIERQYQTFAHLIDAQGERVTQDDSAPAKGMIPTVLFDAKPLPDIKRLALPADLPAGWYRVDVGAYDAETLAPAGAPLPLTWVQVGAEMPAVTADGAWQNGLRLTGHDGLPSTLAPNETVSLRLFWSAAKMIPDDLTVFMHLTAANGTMVAQADRAPLGGFYPTSAWRAGNVVADSYTLTLPAEMPPPPYTLVVGWYAPATQQRAPLSDGGETLTLTTIR